MAMENLIKATNALNRAGDAYHGKIDAIRDTLDAKSAEVDAKKDEIDAKVDALFDILNAPFRMPFDPNVILTKNGMNLAVDPTDNSRTVWQSLAAYSLPANSVHQVPNAPHICVLHMSFSSPQPVGRFNNPIYSQDHSQAVPEFVVAPYVRTSEQINQAIADNDIVPGYDGDFLRTGVCRVPATEFSWSRLYVRFRNIIDPRAAPHISANATPQPIATHGGDPRFALHELAMHIL